MKKIIRMFYLFACIPFVLTSCDLGTEVRRDVYLKEVARIEEQEVKVFNTIELNYNLESKATGYFKEQGGLNASEKGQLIFVFDSSSWESNEEVNFGEVNNEVVKALNARASEYYKDLESAYGYNIKYYVNPLGLGYETSASEGRNGIAMTEKFSIRITFNDYGLLSMLRLNLKYTISDAKTGKDIKLSGEYEVHMQLELNYKA